MFKPFVQLAENSFFHTSNKEGFVSKLLDAHDVGRRDRFDVLLRVEVRFFVDVFSGAGVNGIAFFITPSIETMGHLFRRDVERAHWRLYIDQVGRGQQIGREPHWDSMYILLMG